MKVILQIKINDLLGLGGGGSVSGTKTSPVNDLTLSETNTPL
ncbi:hypothetical protein SAMN05444486_1174 [Lentibacter algarum]|uniref:Uncharacterized protein n=1 Tax=Lentibacter algarum TaxID=576131 RepID=A0A1H3NR98_9RHOB|nr:hypothetical protein SAMN05444486_1174 [Lentibacter algarum]